VKERAREAKGKVEERWETRMEEGWALYRLGPLLFLHTRPKKTQKKSKKEHPL
jgi:hypothetical protein